MSPSGVTFGVYGDLAREDPGVVPSGFFDLDYGLLLRGGFTRGKVVELYGPEGGGKSCVSYRVLANAQNMGLKCLLIDSECAVSEKQTGGSWLRKMGVDVDKLLYSREVFAERVFNEILQAITEYDVDVVVCDSVASWTTLVETERYRSGKSYSDRLVAAKPGVVTAALPEVRVAADTTGALVIFTNQVRDLMATGYGMVGEERTPGGRALRHECAIRLRISRIMGKKGRIEENGEQVGNYARAELVKSKVSPPYKKTGEDTPSHLAIYYDGREIDQSESLVGHAKHFGIVDCSGNWISYTFSDGISIKGNGVAQFVEELTSHGKLDDFCNLIKRSTRTVMDSEVAGFDDIDRLIQAD